MSQESIYPNWIYFVAIFLLIAILNMAVLVVRGIFPDVYLFGLSIVIGVIALWLNAKMNRLFERWVSDE